EVAARPLTARVVDARDLGGVGPLAHQQPVVADGRTDDAEHTRVDELVEVAAHVVGAPAGQAGGLAGQQLYGPVQLDLAQSLADRLLEPGTSVWLRKVVQNPDEQRCRSVGHRGGR